MMKENRKIKLVFIKKSSNEIVVDEDFSNYNAENVVKDLNLSTPEDGFPYCTLELNVTIKYPNLISIKTGDRVTIYVSENENEFTKIHSGTLSSVKINSKHQKHELIIKSVNSFHLLKTKKLNSENFKFKSGLRAILKEIVELSTVEGTIDIDNLVSNSFELGVFRNFPAFSLLNIICYNLDLIYKIEQDEHMFIENRMDFINKIYTTMPFVVEEDSIISTSFEQ